MFTFDKSNFLDHQNALNRIERGRNQLRNSLMQLTFDFANKISGSISNDDFLNHRNSIQLRLSSIMYHYDIIASLNISGQEFFSAKNISPSTTGEIALRQDFLFDSIIFNTLSLFDYTSCLVKYIIEKNKQKQKTLWSKLANSARGQLIFKDSKLAKVIDNIDRNWVLLLGNYRAKLIHYNDDSVNDGLAHNLISGKYIIHISAPYSLKKYFKEFKKEENRKVNINEVSLWIIENSIRALLEITKELISYLDSIRLIPPGKEVYIIKK